MVPAKLLEKQFGWVGAGGEHDKATRRSSAGLRQTARPEKVNSFCLEGHQPLIRSREQGGKEQGDES